MQQALALSAGGGELVADSAVIRDLGRRVQELADEDVTVLILGETGVGKGVVAWMLHDQGRGARGGPFVSVNRGALPEGLIDSELFGHGRGAFTGAASRRLGRFELANGGTLFLDQIGDLPLDSQTCCWRCWRTATFSGWVAASRFAWTSA